MATTISAVSISMSIKDRLPQVARRYHLALATVTECACKVRAAGTPSHKVLRINNVRLAIIGRSNALGIRALAYLSSHWSSGHARRRAYAALQAVANHNRGSRELCMHSDAGKNTLDPPRAVSVYPGHRVLAMFPFFNEEGKLSRLAARMSPRHADEFLGVNDGSSDNGPAELSARSINFISQARQGVGSCIKAAIQYAREHGFDILVVMAGNGKDDPAQIPDLLRPILEGRADYVQGSRYLPGGSSPNLPLFRDLAIRALSIFFRLYTGEKCTDLTNGFRAYRLAVLDDPRIDINQSWLDGYEFE
ncbi:MAG: glycosyltransferase family 2 protein, partial [Acidobacteriia bacterium]|nr:glycosyltransferase family 2 protein [Terriglobia bacterium]